MNAGATQIVESLDRGQLHGTDDLLAELYHDLRRFAASRLASEKPGQTLQATALVHEAWVRLAADSGEQRKWKSREHFFGAAAEAMRRILIENARRKNAVRHGGGQVRVEFDGLQAAAGSGPEDVLEVSEALDLLAAHAPEKAELVKLRYFAGLTLEEAAEIRGISVPTAKRQWAYARAWLFRKIQELRES